MEANTEATLTDLTDAMARANSDFNQVSVKIEYSQNDYAPESPSAYFGPDCARFYYSDDDPKAADSCDCDYNMFSSYMTEYHTDIENDRGTDIYTLIYTSEYLEHDTVPGFIVGKTAFGFALRAAEGSIAFDREISALISDAYDHGIGFQADRSKYVGRYVNLVASHELGHLIGYLHDREQYVALHNPATDCLMRAFSPDEIITNNKHPAFCKDTDIRGDNSCQDNIADHLGFTPNKGY